MVEFECPECRARNGKPLASAHRAFVCFACRALPNGTDKSELDLARAQRILGRQAMADEDDDDDDKPKKKKGEKAKGGMGMGMILGIVGVLLVCCICTPAGGGLVFFFMYGVGNAAQRVTTINNAKQIALAAQVYHDTNKHLPSPRTNGGGDLSWRVEILPYLEQGPMFNQFDKKVAWDKAPNQALLSQRPIAYDSPLHSVADRTQTRWQCFTGPGTMFPNPTMKVKFIDIADGTPFTILFAEAASPVPWSRPADITMQGSGPVPVVEGTFIAAFCDGTVRPIDRKQINDQQIREMVHPSDGKLLPPGLN
jgi:Protein of unknown function (DUF1559)